MNLEEALHRISDLRTSRDDFDEYYCKEHERLLLKMIESVNTTIDQVIELMTHISSDGKFTIVVTKEDSND